MNTAAIESYMEENAVSWADAETAIKDQDLLTHLISERDVPLGVEADIWLRRENGVQVVHLRTQDEELASAIRQIAFNATTVQRHSGTPQDRGKITPETQSRVRSVTPGVQGMYVDLAQGALVIETTDLLGASEVNELRQTLPFPEIAINLVEPASDSIQIIGGASLGSCTLGFPATFGSYKGFLTAAHCGTSQVVYEPFTLGSPSTTGTRRAMNYGANADISFMSVPNSNVMTSKIHAQSSIINRGTPASVGTGTTVCHRGKTTGWACGSVSAIDYVPVWSGACPGGACNPVFVHVSAAQAGGDSGGPWVVSSNRPIGIHKGGSATGGWSVYSLVSYMPSGASLY